jgi:hypothetical protein
MAVATTINATTFLFMEYPFCASRSFSLMKLKFGAGKLDWGLTSTKGQQGRHSAERNSDRILAKQHQRIPHLGEPMIPQDENNYLPLLASGNRWSQYDFGNSGENSQPSIPIMGQRGTARF